MKNSNKDIRPTFPFAAIVGQDEMKLSLILNVIDPKIGGVIIMGDRGTGKSTTIRAIADLLPTIKIAEGDPFNSSISDPNLMGESIRQVFESKTPIPHESISVPLVDLPLGATEDRVCGSIDMEKAVQEGIKAFEPGLLARANRGILYVDEVNLLDDHLVDVLLDAAASGWNTVEREGISIKHPAQFILVGSGNPEEGELRPQLLDRFGMHAEIRTVQDPVTRVTVVQQRAVFDMDPDTFKQSHYSTTQILRERIETSRKRLSSTEIDYDLRVKISKVCSQLKVDGLRGDIVINRAAKAYAAYNGANSVTSEHILAVIVLCLRHRLRNDPLAQIASTKKDIILTKFREIFS